MSFLSRIAIFCLKGFSPSIPLGFSSLTLYHRKTEVLCRKFVLSRGFKWPSFDSVGILQLMFVWLVGIYISTGIICDHIMSEGIGEMQVVVPNPLFKELIYFATCLIHPSTFYAVCHTRQAFALSVGISLRVANCHLVSLFGSCRMVSLSFAACLALIWDCLTKHYLWIVVSDPSCVVKLYHFGICHIGWLFVQPHVIAPKMRRAEVVGKEMMQCSNRKILLWLQIFACVLSISTKYNVNEQRPHHVRRAEAGGRGTAEPSGGSLSACTLGTHLPLHPYCQDHPP